MPFNHGRAPGMVQEGKFRGGGVRCTQLFKDERLFLCIWTTVPRKGFILRGTCQRKCLNRQRSLKWPLQPRRFAHQCIYAGIVTGTLLLFVAFLVRECGQGLGRHNFRPKGLPVFAVTRRTHVTCGGRTSTLFSCRPWRYRNTSRPRCGLDGRQYCRPWPPRFPVLAYSCFSR